MTYNQQSPGRALGNLLRGLALIAAVAPSAHVAATGAADPVSVTGTKRLLVVAVRFPDVAPAFSPKQIVEKAGRIDRFLRDASYGKMALESRVVGWHQLPAPLSEYHVSPFNYTVDKTRVRRLLQDALAAAGRDVAVRNFDAVWIVVGARTRPGEGYGMIAYCANPGMLSGVRGERAQLEAVTLLDGTAFALPTVVSAENAHVGHVAHDLLHALGGASGGKRTVPDLYDFDLQSDATFFNNQPRGTLHPKLFATHAGPWDLMSQHFIELEKAPPPPSSFTRRQLGWIGADQIVTAPRGETREFTLAPLAGGRGTLVIRIPIDANRWLLLENRQPMGGDQVLPAHGLLVLEIDMTRTEGGGIVRVANANPGTANLYGAPFRPGAGERRYYAHADSGVAVVPLDIAAGGSMRVVVTTPGRIAEFLSRQEK